MDEHRLMGTWEPSAGAFEAPKDVYWDIRPRHDLGTIEFRIFDAPRALTQALGLAALTRCLVIEGLRLLEEQPELVNEDPYAIDEFWAD